MSNSTYADWDEASPASSDKVVDGASEIRLVRQATRSRLEKEHATIGNSDVGGEHLQGSARIYSSTTEPTTIPNGLSALGSSDEGRLWVDEDDDSLSWYDGSNWNYILPPDDSITKSMLADSILGTGLKRDTDDTITLDIGSSLDLSSGSLEVKDASLGVAKLETNLDLSSNVITLEDPTVNDFTNASHTHADTANGGALTGQVLKTWLASSNQSAVRCVINSYTGDSNSTQDISTTGLDPIAVFLLKDAASNSISVKLNSMLAADTFRINSSSDAFEDLITLGTEKFTVEGNANDNGKTYYYLALGLWA